MNKDSGSYNAIDNIKEEDKNPYLRIFKQQNTECIELLPHQLLRTIRNRGIDHCIVFANTKQQLLKFLEEGLGMNCEKDPGVFLEFQEGAAYFPQVVEPYISENHVIETDKPLYPSHFFSGFLNQEASLTDAARNKIFDQYVFTKDQIMELHTLGRILFYKVYKYLTKNKEEVYSLQQAGVNMPNYCNSSSYYCTLS